VQGAGGEKQLHSHLLLLTDDVEREATLLRTLATAGLVEVMSLTADVRPRRVPSSVVVDLDLRCERSIARLREIFRQDGLGSAARIFLVHPDDYQGDRQARALGASRLAQRPLEPQRLLQMMRTDMAAAFKQGLEEHPSPVLARGLRSAHRVLDSIFEDMPRGGLLHLPDVHDAENAVLDSLADNGLKSWLDAVKVHHSSSYRHSLFVTGSAISFAQFLGMSRKDQRRVAQAALLHDVGKAFIPLAILDKPGKLTSEEFAEIKKHPRFGYDTLGRCCGIPAETLDAVLHHHEHLDGTGYPDGLAGREIKDLVRIITIADIFSALVEERAYKPALSSGEALRIMGEMGPKLDVDMLRVFGEMIAGQEATLRVA
jgi:HD-GYP domain-containing protein (c-di-GMP phosphodiesterase class II)